MSSEQSFCAHLVVQVFNDGPGKTQTVKGAGAPADFVEDNQAAGGGIVKNIGGLAHLDHEGGLSAREVIAGAYPGKDTIQKIDARLVCRDE